MSFRQHRAGRFVSNPRLVAGAFVIGAIVVFALWPSAVEIDVARVQRGPMQVTIDEEGETRVRERFVVSAPVSGRLHRIELEPGDSVVRGKTVVARLTPAQAPLIDPRTDAELSAAVEATRASIGQARAERDRAAAALTRGRSTVTRLEALVGAGAISRDELEAAQTSLRVAEEASRAAEFTVTRAEYEHQLARARLAPSRTGGGPVTVLAPVDGVVLKRLRESESVVPVGAQLLEIGDPASLEIVADLLSTDAVRVSPGDAVTIEHWGGSQTLDARVRRIEPSGFLKVSALGVEEQRVNVIIDFDHTETPPRHLGDGYRVEVRIVIWRAEAALTVPTGSLFRHGADWAVFVIDAGRARLHPVKIGQYNDISGEIKDGLAEGQTVVLHPPDTLTDGTRVSIRGATP